MPKFVVLMKLLWKFHQQRAKNCHTAINTKVCKKKLMGDVDFQVRFDCTIPAGADTCHFTLWRASDEERDQWDTYTRVLEEKALRHAINIPPDQSRKKHGQKIRR